MNKATLLQVALIATLVSLTQASPASARPGGGGWFGGGGQHNPPTAVPEIDPSGIASAMTLVFGGLAVLADRRRKTK